MKLNLDLKSGSLKTDIKSLKKAARQAIAPELGRRVKKIVKISFQPQIFSKSENNIHVLNGLS